MRPITPNCSMVNRQVDGFMFKPLRGEKTTKSVMSIADVQTTPAVSLAYVNHTCRTSLLRGSYRGIPKKKTQLRGLERFPALRWIHGVAPESNSLAPARPPCKNMNTSTALQCDSVMFIGPKGDHLQESHVSHFEDTLRRTKSPSW